RQSCRPSHHSYRSDPLWRTTVARGQRRWCGWRRNRCIERDRSHEHESAARRIVRRPASASTGTSAKRRRSRSGRNSGARARQRSDARMTLRAVVVDDEPLPRQRLRDLVTQHPMLTLVGEATNGTEALDVIVELEPDLAFLDIQMPELDGLQVAASLTDE